MHSGNGKVRRDFLETCRPICRRAGIFSRVDSAAGERFIAVSAVHGDDRCAEAGFNIGPVRNAADLESFDIVKAGDGFS